MNAVERAKEGPRDMICARLYIERQLWRDFTLVARRRGLSAAVLDELLIHQFVRKPFPLEIRVD